MTMGTKKELFGIELRVYLQATKDEKGLILDGLVRQTGMHRISIIRAFRTLQLSSPYQERGIRGRRVQYDHACMEALQFLWESADYCCGELLKPVIKERIAIAKKQGLWKWSEEVENKVRSISVATLKRKIPGWRTSPVKRGIATTTPSAIKDSIPLFSGDWKKVSPGNGQIDTVAHCGGTMAGEFIFSCGYIDVATGWTIYRAQWNKGMLATQESLRNIHEHAPFPLVMIHPDCGTEFLNEVVMKWCRDLSIDITRSRSYHKNDNGYIEQRNNHVVRKWFGYSRLEHKELVPQMNAFYEKLSLYSNHFQAQRLCIGTKELCEGNERKLYEKDGMTPYERILTREDVTLHNKKKLMYEHELLNPFTLHAELHALKHAILKLNRALTEERVD